MGATPLVFPGATETAAFQSDDVDQALVSAPRKGDVVVLDNLRPHLAPGVAAAIAHVGGVCCPCRRPVLTTPRLRRCGRNLRRTSAGLRRGLWGATTMSWVMP